jgi:holo-[acyl-carrier protein] synthase
MSGRGLQFRHGVDLVEVPRIERLLSTHGRRFIERCFSAGESAYAERSKKRRAEHYAVRFACKEAVLKALGTGWRDGLAWRDIEIVRDANGAPALQLSGGCGELAASLGIARWSVSLSHTASYAVASVVGYGGA